MLRGEATNALLELLKEEKVIEKELNRLIIENINLK